MALSRISFARPYATVVIRNSTMTVGCERATQTPSKSASNGFHEGAPPTADSQSVESVFTAVTSGPTAAVTVSETTRSIHKHT